jgi:short-subunit dehydrogenase
MTQTILITGATDGLGLALAQHYQSQAARLVLLGRRPLAEMPLAQFSSNNYCQVDLARPDCAEIVTHHLATHQIDRLDLLIHNAGLGYVGPTDQQASHSIQTLTAVNLWAPIALTHALLPHLRAAQGKIVFISSVVSALPCPDYAVYGANKAALDGFARNLRLELTGTVAVQVIHPGPMRTGMHAKSGADLASMRWDRFPPATTVAPKIAQAIVGRQRAVTIGGANRLLRFAGHYLAGPLDWAMRQRSR